MHTRCLTADEVHCSETGGVRQANADKSVYADAGAAVRRAERAQEEEHVDADEYDSRCNHAKVMVYVCDERFP